MCWAKKEDERKCTHHTFPHHTSPLINKTGKLVATIMEKAEILSNFFTSASNSNLSSYISQAPEPQDRDQGLGE